MMTLAEIMTEHPFTLGPKNSVKEAIALMEQEQIRHIPIVTEGGQLVGLVTQHDMLAARESTLLSSPLDQVQDVTDNVMLEKIMNHHVVSVDPHAGIKEAALYLQRHKYGCLPVVSEGKLVGIVTGFDFIDVAINLLELMEDEWRVEE